MKEQHRLLLGVLLSTPSLRAAFVEECRSGRIRTEGFPAVAEKRLIEDEQGAKYLKYTTRPAANHGQFPARIGQIWTLYLSQADCALAEQ